MGVYDEIVGDDGRRYQVKCWGQRNHEYRVGDVVVAVEHPVPHSVALGEGGFANVDTVSETERTNMGTFSFTAPVLVSITDEPLFEPVITKWGDPANLDDAESLKVPPWWSEIERAVESGDFSRLADVLDEILPIPPGATDEVRALAATYDAQSAADEAEAARTEEPE